jgi:hypothetical protein
MGGFASSTFWIGGHDGILTWMPDLVTAILILVALAAIIGAGIWNFDGIRNDGADPLVNPAWTNLARTSPRRLTTRRSKSATTRQYHT